MQGKDTYITFLKALPSVVEPIRRLTFNDKLKWTAIILFVYYIMSQIPVYGIEKASYEYFRFLEIILGSKFGSLVTLGIGPIVTASIILQLLVGSKIINWDLTTEEGRVLFQGTQKLLTILLSFIEAFAYVEFGAIKVSSPIFAPLVILQLAMGAILILFMDEVVSKWGFGSGVGLFIVAGVAKTIIVRAFNPLTQSGTLPSMGNPSAGIIPFSISSLATGDVFQAFLSFMPLISTIIVFFLVIYIQAVRVEIPLAFSMVSGFGRRWPLKFLYTSNIPVILVAALLANIQIIARMAFQRGLYWLGQFDEKGNAVGGLIMYLIPPNNQAISGAMTMAGVFALLGAFYLYTTKKKGGVFITLFLSILGIVSWIGITSYMGITSLSQFNIEDITRAITYMLFLIVGSTIFSIFWVNTSGMDAESVANQIYSTGLSIPGYRRDIRIIKRVLNRYIPVLAILGGASVGFLAAYADLTNALGTGTGILLAVMIVYQMYEQIAMQHIQDMHPTVRKFFGK